MTSTSAQPPPAVAAASCMEEMFRLLERGDGSLVQEMQEVVREHFSSETKDPWLVNSLYDQFAAAAAESPRFLQLLLAVAEPHDKFLMDRMSEGVRAGGAARATAFAVLGCLVRKQPPWLPKICQHALFREWLKVLKTEDDLVILLSALLGLLAMMPILPSHLGGYLHDLFEVFRYFFFFALVTCPGARNFAVASRLGGTSTSSACLRSNRCTSKWACTLSSTAFMACFPATSSPTCAPSTRRATRTTNSSSSTLSVRCSTRCACTRCSSRTRGSSRRRRAGGRSSSCTTYSSSRRGTPSSRRSRRGRKGNLRCSMSVSAAAPSSPRRLQVRPEGSRLQQGRYLLDRHDLAFVSPFSWSSDIHDLCSALSHGDPLWTPGRRLELSTPPYTMQPQNSLQTLSVPHQHYLDSSPPETAIEATPGGF